MKAAQQFRIVVTIWIAMAAPSKIIALGVHLKMFAPQFQKPSRKTVGALYLNHRVLRIMLQTMSLLAI